MARESGVSYSTVSRVLNDYPFVRESTRQRVLEAAERLGYVVNLQARSLAGGRSNIVGLLVPGLDNGYLGEIVRGIDLELTRSNYDLMLYTTHNNQGKEQQYVKAIANGLVDGLLLIVPLAPTTYIETLLRANFPCVLIDQADPSPNSATVDSTNWQGAYDATTHLIQFGHRRIAHVTGEMRLRAAGERLDGYRSALHDHQIPFLPELVVEGDFRMESGTAATDRLLSLKQPPSAIFASNDLMAFGVIEAARTRGMQVPDDLSVVGFDDIPQASLLYPKLTSVRQPLEQMGRVGAKLLLERIDNPDQPGRRVTLATELMIRESTAQA